MDAAPSLRSDGHRSRRGRKMVAPIPNSSRSSKFVKLRRRGTYRTTSTGFKLPAAKRQSATLTPTQARLCFSVTTHSVESGASASAPTLEQRRRGRPRKRPLHPDVPSEVPTLTVGSEARASKSPVKLPSLDVLKPASEVSEPKEENYVVSGVAAVLPLLTSWGFDVKSDTVAKQTEPSSSSAFFRHRREKKRSASAVDAQQQNTTPNGVHPQPIHDGPSYGGCLMDLAKSTPLTDPSKKAERSFWDNVQRHFQPLFHCADATDSRGFLFAPVQLPGLSVFHFHAKTLAKKLGVKHEECYPPGVLSIVGGAASDCLFSGPLSWQKEINYGLTPLQLICYLNRAMKAKEVNTSHVEKQREPFVNSTLGPFWCSKAERDSSFANVQCPPLFSSSTWRFFPLPRSKNLCVIRFKWNYEDQSRDEDILWDILAPDHVVCCFVDKYLDEFYLPVETFRSRFLSLLQRHILLARWFRFLFDTVCNYLTHRLKLSSPRCLPGITKSVVLDCSYQGVRILDSISWNLTNNEQDMKCVLEQILHDMRLPLCFISTLFPAFLRAVYREKLEHSDEIWCAVTMEPDFAAPDQSTVQQQQPSIAMSVDGSKRTREMARQGEKVAQEREEVVTRCSGHNLSDSNDDSNVIHEDGPSEHPKVLLPSATAGAQPEHHASGVMMTSVLSEPKQSDPLQHHQTARETKKRAESQLSVPRHRAFAGSFPLTVKSSRAIQTCEGIEKQEKPDVISAASGCGVSEGIERDRVDKSCGLQRDKVEILREQRKYGRAAMPKTIHELVASYGAPVLLHTHTVGPLNQNDLASALSFISVSSTSITTLPAVGAYGSE